VSFPTLGQPQYRRYRLDAGKFCAGAVDDPQDLAFFYGRDGPRQKRAQHDHDEHQCNGAWFTVLWVLYGYSNGIR